MRAKTSLLTALLLSLTLLGCSAPQVNADGGHAQTDREKQGSSAQPGFSEPLGVDELSVHPLFTHFSDVYGAPELITGIAGDCNGDGVEDLTVVFRHSGGGNHLVTVYSGGEEYRLSEEMAAPVEDCLLTWRDIDEAPPVELLVSGRKGTNIGFAIYRFEAGAWTALFGDGMGDCC